jgi:hypothetical protein
MKKSKAKPASNGMRSHYDFSKGVRAKYASRLAKTATVIVLEPDVARHFRTSASVNSALRALARAKPRKSKRSA